MGEVRAVMSSNRALLSSKAQLLIDPHSCSSPSHSDNMSQSTLEKSHRPDLRRYQVDGHTYVDVPSRCEGGHHTCERFSYFEHGTECESALCLAPNAWTDTKDGPVVWARRANTQVNGQYTPTAENESGELNDHPLTEMDTSAPHDTEGADTR